MMKYLADTNVLSELAKSVPNQAVLEKFRQHSAEWHGIERARMSKRGSPPVICRRADCSNN